MDRDRKLARLALAAGLIAGGMTFLAPSRPPAVEAANSVVVDGAGDVGQHASLQLNAAGNPVVSYFDATNHRTKVATCTDVDCAGKTVATVRANDALRPSSLQLDQDGLPLVATTHDHGWVIRCVTPDCTGGGETVGEIPAAINAPSLQISPATNMAVVSYDFAALNGVGIALCATPACDAGSTFRHLEQSVTVGPYTSLQSDFVGNLLVAYDDVTSGSLKLLRCAFATCVVGSQPQPTVNAVDTTTDVGEQKSLALDAQRNPVISYYDQTNGNLKLVRCNDLVCAGGNERIVTLDTTGDVGQFNSLQLDAAGNPVISYYDETNGNLKLVRCDDPDCAGGGDSVVTVESSGDVGRHSSLQLDAAGNPVIAYYDATDRDLLLIHCDNPTCAPESDPDDGTTTVDRGGEVGEDSSTVLDAAGNPVVAYYDATNTSLKLLHCNDRQCSGGDDSIVTVDDTGNVGRNPSLQLTTNGHPVIAYYDATNGDLRVARCADANCRQATVFTLGDSGPAQDLGRFPSLQLDSAGNPVIAHFEATNGGRLYLYRCTQPDCSAATGRVVDDDPADDPGVGRHPSLELGPDGHPVISYHDFTNGDLMLARCNDLYCDGANEQITTVDSAGTVGRFSSLELDFVGNPVISYADDSNGDLKYVHCDHPACAGGAAAFTVTVDAGSGTPPGQVGAWSSLQLRAGGDPVISYYDGTNGDLKVAFCDDPYCTGEGQTILTVDASSDDVGAGSSLALDGSGNPIVSYHNATDGDLKILHEARPALPAEPATNFGLFPSLRLDTNGNAVVAYYDAANGDLRLRRCDDPVCAPSGGDVDRPIDTAGNVGAYPSLALSAQGIPMVAYYDVTNGDLKFARCADSHCHSLARVATMSDFPDQDYGLFPSMQIDSAGNPAIAHFETTNGGRLRLIRCTSNDCATGVDNVIEVRGIGAYPSLELQPNGVPVMSYYDVALEDLLVARCGDTVCSPANGQFTAPDRTGSVGRHTSLELRLVFAGDLNPIVSYFDATNGDLKLLAANGTIRTLDTAGVVGSYTSMAHNTRSPVVAYRDVRHGDLKLAVCNNDECATNGAAALDTTGDVGFWASLDHHRDTQRSVVAYYDATNQVLKFASDVPPAAQFGAVESPRTTPVEQIGLTFSEAVTGVGIDDFMLTSRPPGSTAVEVPLSGATLSGSGASYMLSGLTEETTPDAQAGAVFELSMRPGNGIRDLTGNPLGLGPIPPVDPVTFLVDPVPTVTIGPIDPELRNTPPASVSVQFSEPVNGFDAADVVVRRDGTPVDSTALQVSMAGTARTISGWDAVATEDGTYEITIATAGVTDGRGQTLAAHTPATFTLDSTAPTVAIALDPVRSGAYNVPVTVTVTSPDPTATVRCVVDPPTVPASFDDLPGSACSPRVVSTEGAHVVYAAAIDDAGNQSAVTTRTFSIDTTGPTVTITPDPPAPNGDNGWYVGPVGLTIAASETATIRCALDPATAPTQFGDLPATPCALTSVDTDGTHTVYAAASDAAGNTGPVTSLAFQIDETPADVTIALDPAEPSGMNGFWNDAVDVSVTVDGNAAVRCVLDPATPPANFAALADECSIGEVDADGAHTVWAISRDGAGNEQREQVSFTIDSTAPSVAIGLDPASPDGNAPWYVSDVEVDVSATDAVSGSDQVRCVLDPESAPASFDDLPDSDCDLGTVATDGEHTVYAAAVDQAGNKSTVVSRSFQIDQTLPQVTITPDPSEPDGDNGWYVGPVGLAIEASETATIRCALNPETAPGEFADLPEADCDLESVDTDGTYTVYAAASDAAGNTGPVTSLAFQIDQTPADVTIALDPAEPSGMNGFWNDAVDVTVTIDDEGAGLRCVLDPETEPATFAELADECSIGEVDADGSHTVWAISRDEAGNEQLEQLSFTIDSTAPAVEIHLAPELPNGTNDWYVSAVEVTWSATDAVSEVDQVRCVLDPESEPTSFDDLPETDCDLESVDTDGTHTVYLAAVDRAGNKSAVVSRTFQIDQTLPQVTITPDPSEPDGDNGWYVGPVGLAIEADETATIRCALNAETAPEEFADLPEEGCALPGVDTDGDHVVYAAAVDVAGNTGPVTALSFRIDQTAPVVSFTVDPADPDGSNGWYVSPVDVEVLVDDDTATLRCVLDPADEPASYADLPDEPCDLDTLEADGTRVVYAAAVDPAGNVGPIAARELQIDRTAPVPSIQLDPEEPNGPDGAYGAPVDVAVSVDDEAATLRCVINPADEPASYTDLPDGRCAIGTVDTDGEHEVFAAAVDHAGNVSAVVEVSFEVDQAVPIPPTPPTGNLTLIVSDPTPVPGQEITVSATGFEPGVDAAIVLYSTPQLLRTVTVNAQGEMSAAITIPSTTTPGSHVLAVLAGDDAATASIVVVTPTGGGATPPPGATPYPPGFVPVPVGPGYLPKTGTTIAATLALAAITLLAGLALTGGTRRRRRKTVPAQSPEAH